MPARDANQTDAGDTFFAIDDLRAARRWSLAQGPWGIQLDVVGASRRHGDVLEVFAPATIVPAWRLYADGGSIRLTSAAGGERWFTTLKDALLSIAPVPASSDMDLTEIFPN